MPSVRRASLCRLGSASVEPKRWRGAGATAGYGQGRLGILRRGLPPLMYAVFPEQSGKSHPEIYPLIERQARHPPRKMASNSPSLRQPGNQTGMNRGVNAYLDAHPECHTYPFGINDNNTWCECDLLQGAGRRAAALPRRKIYSGPLYTFVNAVARGPRPAPGQAHRLLCLRRRRAAASRIERMEPNVFINLTQDTAHFDPPIARSITTSSARGSEV